MSIQFSCEHCGTTHLVNDRFAGKRVRCPTCEAAVQVPIASTVDETEEELKSSTIDEGAAQPEGTSEELLSQQVEVPASSAPDTPNIQVTGSEQTSVNDEDDDEPVLPRQRRPEEEMDMTPMVDVTFLLLIFFMVTAAFSLQKSIEMPKQQTDAPSTSVQEEEVEELDMVELEVDEFGSFLVLAPEWERETPGKQNLISALKEAIAGNQDGMQLNIKVHEMAKLKVLVDAMDAGTIAGFAKLEVMQVEGFD